LVLVVLVLVLVLLKPLMEAEVYLVQFQPVAVAVVRVTMLLVIHLVALLAALAVVGLEQVLLTDQVA
jgi:hypothetical protein